MPRMSGAQAITESLKVHQVDTIFGIISVHTLDLFDVLFDDRDSLRFIGCRQELGAGFMADGYARATGKPGVLLTSTGPGAADSVGALGEAYYSSSPVLELTTNVEQEYVNSGKLSTHETKDQLGMFKAVTDWNAFIDQIESIPDHMVEAFQRFQARRPRPIELELPTDLLGKQAEVEVLSPREPDIPQGDPVMVERALDALLKANRPVIFVGEEVQSLGGTEEIIRLAETLGAPIVTGDGAKGAIPEDHPLSLGQISGPAHLGGEPSPGMDKHLRRRTGFGVDSAAPQYCGRGTEAASHGGPCPARRRVHRQELRYRNSHRRELPSRGPAIVGGHRWPGCLQGETPTARR